MKKSFFIVTLTVLFIIVGYYFYPNKIRKEEDVAGASRIRIGYNTESITSASVIVAYEKKYFQKYNLSPEMVPLKSGKEVVQAMAAGQVDVGLGGLTNFMPAMAKDAPMRFIAASAASPSYIFVRPNENINRFTDLYGKTVSVTSKGINELIFRTAINRENIDTGKMKFIEIERAYNVSALLNKKAVDAAVVSEQDTEMFLKAGAIVLPEWESKGYSQEAEPRNFIAVRSDFLNKQEAVVEKFLEACIDAHRLISANPKEAAELLVKHIKEGSAGAVNHSPEKIVEQWSNKEIVNMIWQDPGITMDLAKKAREVGVMDKDLTIEQAFDLRFEKKLEAAQEEIYGRKN